MKTYYLLISLLLSCACMGGKTLDDSTHREGVWQRDTIRAGLVWHNFEGMDSISGAVQIVNVIEMDLDREDLRLSFVYYPDKMILSDVADDTRAVAATNASFGVPHTFIRTEGETYCEIDVEPGSRDWWKHEAAVWYDGKNNLGFFNFDGKPVEAVEAYRACEAPNIYSGTPILIDDYQYPQWEVGKGYGAKRKTIQDRHPRTAIALTDKRQLLLVTVDGRWQDRASGMSCEELRRFLTAHFNPRWAMNMDGGGSSSMFVKGRGDKDTGIVNYPCEKTGETGEGYSFDHSHERKLPTFFVINEVKVKSKVKKK